MKTFEELSSQIDKLQARLNRESGGAKRQGRNFYLRDHAIEIGELAPGIEYWIVGNPMGDEVKQMRAREAAGELPEGSCNSMPTFMQMEGALNGYVAFPKRAAPLVARSLWSPRPNILDYLPVHGGVTYAVKDSCACVYGFDTAHFDSDHLPRSDRRWIAWQCRVLYESILLAAKVEKAYLRSQSNEERSKLLQPLVDAVPEQGLSLGAMLNVLAGEL